MNKKKGKIFFISLLICLIIFVLVNVYKNDEVTIGDVNYLRIESNAIYQEIQTLWPISDNDVDFLKKEDKGIITIIDLNEEVIYSNSDSIDFTNDSILMRAFYVDDEYINNNPNSSKITQPIYSQNKLVGFFIYETNNIIKSNNSIHTLNLINIILSLLIISCIILIGIEIFKNDSKELKKLEDGYINISKGVFKSIKNDKKGDYFEVYQAYNSFVEELEYMFKEKENSDEQRNSFLTMISHELKTPISSIVAYVEGLKIGIANNDEKRERYINIISDKTKQLAKQVDDFFKYAQNQSNSFKYNFIECYADELIEDIFNNISEEKYVKVIRENFLPKCIINVDKIRIEQVVMNLYNNAQKHIGENGIVNLKAYLQDNDMVIEVEDNGTGISIKDLPHIFESYYQGEDSKKTDYQGVGLGLSICKQIIDSHKGEIKVKSKKNHGTILYVIIPIV